MLLCRSEEKVALFDVQQRSVVAELATPPVKYAVWSSDMSRVALLRCMGAPGGWYWATGAALTVTGLDWGGRRCRCQEVGVGLQTACTGRAASHALRP